MMESEASVIGAKLELVTSVASAFVATAFTAPAIMATAVMVLRAIMAGLVAKSTGVFIQEALIEGCAVARKNSQVEEP